ncbi:MAG TPA: ribbon-helix-helix protein, CopG family [Clostridia bacterium]|nr:ribbon-helix-helix protein, CopG family [Clostridia bacterium]
MAKTEQIYARVDSKMKAAIDAFAKKNHVDISSVVRLALANYPPIAEELKKIEKKS